MNILMVGLGSIAAKHIHAIKELYPNAGLWALRSRKTDITLDPVTNFYSLDELPDKPDFVVIANPTFLHYETITNVSVLGVPIMIEKPVLHTLKDSDALIQKLKKGNIVTYVACNLRFHPALLFLKRYLTQGKRINEVNIYCGSFLPDWRPGKDFRSIYSANTDMGGGVHLDLIHELDYCYWLFGSPVSFTSIKRNNSSLDITAADYAHYCLCYEQYIATITLNYYRKDAKRQLEILFDGETWLIDLLTCEIRDDQNNIIFSQSFSMMDSYRDQIKYFVNAIQQKKVVMNDIGEACEVLKICLGGV